jgi:mannose-6-phosphate isomerase-like protein (cupin superfamily)
VIPRHVHSQVTDWYFCLSGTLRIETRAPSADEQITAGERYAIAPKTADRISNGGDGECRFLLLLGLGSYDFYKIADFSGN